MPPVRWRSPNCGHWLDRRPPHCRHRQAARILESIRFGRHGFLRRKPRPAELLVERIFKTCWHIAPVFDGAGGALVFTGGATFAKIRIDCDDPVSCNDRGTRTNGNTRPAGRPDLGIDHALTHDFSHTATRFASPVKSIAPVGASTTYRCRVVRTNCISIFRRCPAHQARACQGCVLPYRICDPLERL